MSQISSNYLKFNIEDLNKEILYDPTEEGFMNPNLPLTQNVISKCWKYYSLESSDGENIERFPVPIKDFNSKTGIKKFDFKALDNSLDFVDLKRDLFNNISSMQQDHISAIDKILLRQSTGLQISHKLSLFIDDIRRSIISLQNLSTNRSQTVLKDLLLKSYDSALEKINSKYTNYLPEQSNFILSEEEKELNEFIYPDRIIDFKKIESKLISTSWIILENGLYEWNKNKTTLVDLCRYIKKKEITRGNKSVSDIARFLQDRYTTDVGTLKKPSKFKSRALKTYKFEFLLD